MAKKTKKYVDEHPKTMMLVKSAFGSMKSFKLLPISNDCIKIHENIISYGSKTR